MGADSELPKGNSITTTVTVTAVSNDSTTHSSTDGEDMRRMGRDQELIRNFRMFSMASFAAMATAVWEFSVFQLTPALVDGGLPSLVWSTVWNFAGFLPIYLSMAEMASMAPIAGAQYHWVSEFAPRSMQRVLSYVSGWTSTLGLQAGNALGVLLVGTLIQTIIVINVEDYTARAWHGSLLVIVAICFAFTGSVVGYKVLHYWQNAAFAIHVMAYFAVLIPIWVNAPEATHEQVWTKFENRGNWSSMSLAILIGQLPGASSQIGLDAAAHMSEEVRNASTAVPRAMLLTYAINFVLLFPMIITAAYHMPDLDLALADSTTYPFVYVLKQSMSTTWVTLIIIVTVVILVGSNIAFLTVASRDLYAFARDDGLPFSNWLSQLSKNQKVPANAVIVSCSISFLLALIYIGSNVAFYAITSLATVALLQCYVLSITCILWRRVAHPETLPHASFSLGRWGVPVNVAAVVYGIWGFFWAFWPQVYPVTAGGFNWASPLFAAAVLGALVNYIISGRKKWLGPVALVEGRKADSETKELLQGLEMTVREQRLSSTAEIEAPATISTGGLATLLGKEDAELNRILKLDQENVTSEQYKYVEARALVVLEKGLQSNSLGTSEILTLRAALMSCALRGSKVYTDGSTRRSHNVADLQPRCDIF